MTFLHRRTAVWIVVVIVVLVALRLALPYLVKDVLNRRMDRMGDYHGQVADVGLALWRGGYTLDHLRVDKVSGKVPVPLFDAARTDISLSWDALLHGRIRGKVTFQHATLNFVDGKNDAEQQVGTGVNWRVQLQRLMPMQLDELTVHDSAVTFHNFVSHPPVDLKMTDIEATVRNLSNADRREGRRVATLHATAKVLGDAPLETSASFDPLEKGGDFKFDLRITGIQLTRLNDLVRAYAKLDFAGGNGEFVMQLEAQDGMLKGYAKPLLHGVKIFSWKQDVEEEHKNPLRVAWEAVAQAVESVFKNHEQNQFATRVPISGRIDDKHLGMLQAVLGVLRNAFVKAYTPQLERLRPAPEKPADQH